MIKEWVARSPGLVDGIGNDRAAAFDSLVRSNLAAFGITKWIDRDWKSDVPETIWTSDGSLSEVNIPHT
jgi:hypothetical protein